MTLKIDIFKDEVKEELTTKVSTRLDAIDKNHASFSYQTERDFCSIRSDIEMLKEKPIPVNSSAQTTFSGVVRKPASFKEVTELEIVPEDVIEQLNSLNQKSVASKADDDKDAQSANKVTDPSKKGTSPSPKHGEGDEEED